jgi:hypothetical protein
MAAFNSPAIPLPSVVVVPNNETVAGTLGVTGAVLFSSNLGVSGTLGANGATNLFSTLNVTGATALASTLGVTGVTTVAAGSAALPSVVSVTGTSDTGVWFPAADTIAASTAGSERLRIDSTGNVGIGTASPSAFLHLSSTGEPAIKITNTSMSGSPYALFAMNAGNSAMFFETTSGKDVKFYNGQYPMTMLGSNGYVGIGLQVPVYQLQVNTDSAGKPGVGGLWTVVSDERIKTDIVPADLDRCYEIVKAVPLKHFGFKPGVYTDEQIQDKHSLGWIAQDVQRVFEKAVSVKPFTLHTDIPDGTEDYEEQAFTLDQVETTTTSIQIIDGKPVQVSKTETAENKVLLFDTVDVLDESGAVVMNGDMPLTYQMPRMVTKTKRKVRHETIEDCLDLNSGQMIAALYGCVQALMAKVEALEARG